jgi:predicted RNA-binding protein YlxR (DUF448 family)
MRKKAHVPIRTCIGCGRKRKKEEMLRFIKGTDKVVFVNKKRINGRGFYLCPDLVCFKMAQKKEKWVGSLESIDLLFPLVKGFGIREEG